MAGEQLRVIEGEDVGRRLTIEAELLIGRGAPAGAGRLGGDHKLSRRHARITRGNDGRLRIDDLGSTNGTLVNGERIDEPRTLESGDRIEMGSSVLEVTPGEGSAPVLDEPTAARTVAPLAPPAREPAVRPPAPEELVITSGPGRLRRLTVGDELILGRAVSADGDLSDDPRISRRHARVGRDDAGQLTVQDLGSANGTFLNGERILDRRLLHVGDTLRVGSTTLQVSAPEPDEASAAEPDEASAAEPDEASAGKPPLLSAPMPAPSAVRPPPVSVLAAGTVFAGCRIETMLGYGDMGVVYAGQELALQRPVALKLIRPEYSRDEHFQARFRRECRLAAAIDHQNIIPLFDAGEESGVLYITMRLVEGPDLRTRIVNEGRLEVGRAARVVSQVGAALDAAHSRGMVHRDVKSSNVLLAREDHAYLSDFGLAKPGVSTSALTRQRSMVGRVEYVAPEQLLGQSVDARADVYALGCVLFEALTGEPPFARWSGGPAALAPVEAPPPSPTERCPDLPAEFDDIVRRAMATDPDERYPSAGELARAVLASAGPARRARPSVLIPGAAAAAAGPAQAAPHPGEDGQPVRGAHEVIQFDPVRCALALALLVAVAIGMVAALHGISSLK